MAARAQGANVVLRSREMNDMLAAAMGGAGLAVLPCLLGDEEAGLVRLTPAVLATREVWLVYQREFRLSAPAQAVIRFVVQVMRRTRLAYRACVRRRIRQSMPEEPAVWMAVPATKTERRLCGGGHAANSSGRVPPIDSAVSDRSRARC
jgi:hypothetical protein